MNLFFFTVFGFYFLLMLLLIIGWQESFVRNAATKLTTPRYRKMSVIVPVRNEETCVARIIGDLLNQRHIAQLMEVLLVDDHSTDRSVEIISQAIAGRENFHVLSLPSGTKGKKQAIAMAVEWASGEIIVTTDADCRLPQDWLSIIQESFENPEVNLVFGGVRIERDEKFFSGLQALEFCSLVGTGAAAASLGFPIMCNAANLAYRKSSFQEVEGYEGNYGIPSGDDEFLLRKIDLRFPGSIYFLPSPEAVVTTGPLVSVNAFVHQRRRWAGKWKHNDSLVSQLLAVFILVFQTSFFFIWIAPLFGWIDWRFGLGLVLFKMLFEFVFLLLVGMFLKVKWEWRPFLVLQFLYPVYVTFIGFSSLLSEYEWKGRSGKG